MRSSKTSLVLLCLFSLSLTSSWAQTRSDVYVLRSHDQREDQASGNYDWSYELSDGTKQNQKGRLEAGGDGQVQEGSYSYIAPNNEVIQVTYKSDKNGYRPVSDALPTSPPIPEAIQRALYLLYKNAQEQIKRGRSQRETAQLLLQKPALTTTTGNVASPRRGTVRIVRRVKKIQRSGATLQANV